MIRFLCTPPSLDTKRFARWHHTSLAGTFISKAAISPMRIYTGTSILSSSWINLCNCSGVQAAPGHHCVLQKLLYGAHQAGKIWEDMLNSQLLLWEFMLSVVKQRLYFLRTDNNFIILCVVLNDIAFASNNMNMMQNLKNNLQAEFDTKLYGNMKSFILWTITRTTTEIYVNRAGYARRLLSKFGPSNCNSVKSPLSVQVTLEPCGSTETPLGPNDHHKYWSMIGGLTYLSTSTRPDLIFAVSALSKSIHVPSARHLTLAKRIFCYLAGTLQYGLCFPIGRPITVQSMKAAVDADWSGFQSTRRSTSDFFFAVNAALIYWKSGRQRIVSLSSGKAEYVALSACATEVAWLRRLVF